MIEQFTNFCLALVTFPNGLKTLETVAIENRTSMKYSEVAAFYYNLHNDQKGVTTCAPCGSLSLYITAHQFVDNINTSVCNAIPILSVLM